MKATIRDKIGRIITPCCQRNLRYVSCWWRPTTGSQAGGERAAAIYSVIETAKLNGIEPQAYITDVIAKIADGWPASRWDELMPWNWARDETPIAQAA